MGASITNAGATARVVYGDCSCWWSGSVGGDFGQHYASDTTTIVIDEQSRITEIWSMGDEVLGYSLDLSDDPIPPGATGTFRATIGGWNHFGLFTTDPFQAWINPDVWGMGVQPGPLQVTITTHDMLSGPLFDEGSRRLEGSVTGTVVSNSRLLPDGSVHQSVGTLNANWSGIYWYDLPYLGGAINCSRLPF